jgi:basic membrane lipoprotein Med (substrate-binding protein (PBP1-ABC) superfamily)
VWSVVARRGWWWGWAVGGFAVLFGVTMWLISTSGASGRQLPPVRARSYSAAQACLLTSPDGLGDAKALAVWQGMQAASAVTKVKVSYVAVSGPATEANALPFAASLIQQKCDVVLGVGAAQIAAVQREAQIASSVRFVAVGAAEPSPNVTVVAAADAAVVKAKVTEIVTKATSSGA